MNERIRIRFTRDGENLAVTHLDKQQGLIFGFENSARPLGFGIEIAAAGPGTAEAMSRVRQREGWSSDQFQLTVTRDEDSLIISGGGKEKTKNLPPGLYRIRFALSETRFREERQDVEIPENGEALLQFEMLAPSARFTLVDSGEWDDEVRDLVGNPKAMIDSMDARSWLNQPVPRLARKACLLNLLATLRSVPSARPGESFCRMLGTIRWADIDRIDLEASDELLTSLQMLPGWKDSGPLDPVHGQRIAAIFGGSPGDYTFESFRQPVMLRSLQIVVGKNRVTGKVAAEVDIDLGNPQMGLAGLCIHVGELLDPGRTNHLDLYDFIRAGAASDFVYYKLDRELAHAGGKG